MLFSQYMQEWLYGDNGYYKHYKPIGKEGDFYTAVSTSRFFGASIANHIYKMIQQNQISKNSYLIEIGAHQGYLLCDMIQWLYSCDNSLVKSMKFAIVEKQIHLQQIQKEYIYSRFGDDIKVEFFNDISEVSIDSAIVVANEIFDAFACELLKDGKIAIVNEHTIEWKDAPISLLKWAEKYYLSKGEIAIGYEKFAQDMAKGIKKCDFISFDYGEKYVRNDFSIRVYSKHQVFPLFDKELNLQQSYKRDDVTYDVNFAHVIDAFEDNGFTLVKYETQARALIRFGIIDILEMFMQQTTPALYTKEADKIKTLLAPTIMGDRFKMVHLRTI
jgi:SAM-dependent MidA family methyltransferase